MKVEFNSLHWDNVDKEMLSAHKRVMEHFQIPVNYHGINMNHGMWMQRVIQQSESDVIVFVEPDWIPINKQRLLNIIKYVRLYNTFVGIAQVSNHIPPKSHIYAAPGFFAITKAIYKRLGEPSFTETRRSDTAEELCYIAEENGVQYRALMPTFFEKPSSEGAWRLSCLGYYGIGTVFDDTVYHLYQSRKAENIELFVRRCDEVIAGTLDTSKFISATTFGT